MSLRRKSCYQMRISTKNLILLHKRKCPQQKFVHQLVYGILAGNKVQLSIFSDIIVYFSATNRA